MTALHHEVLGPLDAPVLLMGGSLGTTVEMWGGQLPLAAHLRLVRFDHRGHGGSPVPPGPYEIEDLGRDVLELMDALDLERASYCGLSLGGMVGMWLGTHAPERIDRLVLLCTAPYMPPPSIWQERAEVVLAAGSVQPIADTVVDRWLTPEFAAAHPGMRAQLRAMLVGTPADGYATCCGAIERMDLRESLAGVPAPTLVISGDRDPSTPVEQQKLIADAIPGARHEVVGPAAHVAAVEQADEVNRLILEHMSDE
jgi:3-oxoadipate enol-lactonase